jgi:uncharacterized protein (TIGR01319 family)
VRVACADVGSTFTKVAVVDVHSGELVGSAGHPSTIGSDVLHGLDAALRAAGGVGCPLRVCSSAGGGLRLAVVGYEALVSAAAAHRVALTAGARVVHVAAGPLDAPALRALRAARPDVLLLVGGTDGGDADVLVHNGARLAAARWRVPVVVAGNADASPAVVAALAGAGVPTRLAGNVLPRLGVLQPEPARCAIRQLFLSHVIGGKRLSRGRRFAALVRGATPDLVLTGVGLLADRLAGDLLVVDVGGATTDVYSALAPGCGEPVRAVTGALWRARTVEGDLGMRSGAPGVLAAAAAERLLPPAADLAAAVTARADDPALLVTDAAGWAVEERLATVAVTVALRRHARAGTDLSGVRLVVGSGGVLRHAPPQLAARVLSAALADHPGGWALPRAPLLAVDVDYVLAAAGLLADEHPAAAAELLRKRLPTVGVASP